MIEPPNSVLLIVGREEFTPPATFDGATCAATHDCVAIGVISVDDAPTLAYFTDDRSHAHLERLGEFTLESEGTVSIRDVYNREYESIGVEPGNVVLTVWSDDDHEPAEIALHAR
jgi:hypothetical protein